MHFTLKQYTVTVIVNIKPLNHKAVIGCLGR